MSFINNSEHYLSVSCDDKVTISVSPDLLNKDDIINQVIFEWKYNNCEPEVVRPIVINNAIQFQASKRPDFNSLLYDDKNNNSDQTARGFSEHISKKGKKSLFLEAMKKIFPVIQDISTESLGEQQTVLYVQLENLDKMIPIGLMSQGANKLAAVLIYIAAAGEGGIVCIDEIENGFHYTKYEGVWRAVYEFAKEFKTQLFVSTHSWECLKAIPNVFSDNQNDLSLIQVYQEKGKSKLYIAEGDEAIAAINNDIEVRR